MVSRSIGHRCHIGIVLSASISASSSVDVCETAPVLQVFSQMAAGFRAKAKRRQEHLFLEDAVSECLHALVQFRGCIREFFELSDDGGFFVRIKVLLVLELVVK